MKRRQFLGTTAALTVALTDLRKRTLFALDDVTASDKLRDESIARFRDSMGLQLYTLRNEIGSDVKSTIKAVADAGYYQVEPYGFPNAKPMIDAARDNGLKINSSHFVWDSVVDPNNKDAPSFGAIVEAGHDAGLKHLVIPYLHAHSRETLDDYRKLSERFNKAAETALEAGIQLAYHNHAFEFEPKEDGVCGFDIMTKEFSNDMKFEVDVFWVEVGGKDPVELIRSLAGRVTQLHLKDLNKEIATPNYGSIPPEAFEELGDGTIDMGPIIEAAQLTGVDICHVEQDHSPHPLDSIQQSMNYLRSL